MGYTSFRLIGFGANGAFFNSGLINSIAIISAAYLITNNVKTRLNSVLLILVFFSGILFARTVILGAFWAFLIIIFKPGRKYVIPIKRYMLFGSMCIISIACFLFILFNGGINEALVEHAFEMFINFSEKGEFSTSSSDALFSFMDIWPQELKTYLIGDGLFENTDGSYYMHTDIGYTRLIYFFGIPGLISFFGLLFFLSKYISKRIDSEYKSLPWILLLMVSISMIKGIGDANFFLYLLISSIIVQAKTSLSYENTAYNHGLR